MRGHTAVLRCALGGSRGLAVTWLAVWSHTPCLCVCMCVGAQVQSFRDDPLVFKGNLRAQTGNELLKVGANLGRGLCSTLPSVQTCC